MFIVKTWGKQSCFLNLTLKVIIKQKANVPNKVASGNVYFLIIITKTEQGGFCQPQSMY